MNRVLILLAASALAIMACDKPNETKQEDPASKNATTTGATASAVTRSANPFFAMWPVYTRQSAGISIQISR